MKTNTLVIAALAWTAGMVGCIDEQHGFRTGEWPAEESSANDQTPEPIKEDRPLASFLAPIFIGGERVQSKDIAGKPSRMATETVEPIEAKV